MILRPSTAARASPALCWHPELRHQSPDRYRCGHTTGACRRPARRAEFRHRPVDRPPLGERIGLRVQRLPDFGTVGRRRFRVPPLRERGEFVFVLYRVAAFRSDSPLIYVRPRTEAHGVDEGGSASPQPGSFPFQPGPTIAYFLPRPPSCDPDVGELSSMKSTISTE